jgi:uncharacterized protein YndB with AHSA1/START domain
VAAPVSSTRHAGRVHVRSDRTYGFAHAPGEVWDAIGRVDAYRDWWPWLRHFDADGLVAGDRWECAVRPPVPYTLRFAITLDEVEEHRRIDASVSGDLAGEATVVLVPTERGCEVRLTSSLAPTGQPLRSVMRVTPWLGRFGHDWVLDVGLRQFRRRAF